MPEKKTPPQRINGKAKGNRFENDIAKLISTWTGTTFERTFRSGGGKVKGDIAPISSLNGWDCVVELKNRESWSIDSFLTLSGVAYEWLMKCWNECSPEQSPVLIMKKNRQPARIIIEDTLLRSFVGEVDWRGSFFATFQLQNTARKQVKVFYLLTLERILALPYIPNRTGTQTKRT